MKKTPLLSVGLLLLAGLSAQAAVIAQWDFAPGTFLVDSVGGYDLVQMASPVVQGTGPGGTGTYSAHFDGTGWLATASTIDLSPYRQVTLNWSFKNQGPGSDPSGIAAILDHGWDVTGSLIVDINENGPGSGYAGVKGTAYGLKTFTNAEDVWANYVMEVNLDAATFEEQVKLFVNGVQVNTQINNPGLAAGYFLNDNFSIGALYSGSFKFVGDIANVSIVATVPEPGTLALLGLGLPLLVCYVRRKRA